MPELGVDMQELMAELDLSRLYICFSPKIPSSQFAAEISTIFRCVGKHYAELRIRMLTLLQLYLLIGLVKPRHREPIVLD